MKQQLASVLLIIISLVGLAAGAKAATHREIMLNIPYDFVVAGRTLPAGRYTVNRLSDDPRGVLSIASDEQGPSVFVFASHFEINPADAVTVHLEHVGGMYFLHTIETLNGVYTLPLPDSALAMAKSAHTGDMSASGTH